MPPGSAEAVASALTAAGLPFETVEDLCRMVARRDPQLQAIASADSVSIVACYPRAVKWLFASAGFPLDMGRTKIANLRAQSTEEALRELLSPETVQGGGDAGEDRPVISPSPSAPTSPEPRPGAGTQLGWFPVIDFDRCTQCMQCLSFCLFGVFAVDAQRRIAVQAPENCKINCPACSRVCPEVAIIFPKYPHEPINGGEVRLEDQRREKVDISSLLGGSVYESLRERSRTRFSAERDPQKALEERRRQLARLMESGALPPELSRALESELNAARQGKS